MFPIVALLIHIPPTVQSSFYSISLSACVISCLFVLFCFFGNSHSNECEVISHCAFYLHFPDD